MSSQFIKVAGGLLLGAVAVGSFMYWKSRKATQSQKSQQELTQDAIQTPVNTQVNETQEEVTQIEESIMESDTKEVKELTIAMIPTLTLEQIALSESSEIQEKAKEHMAFLNTHSIPHEGIPMKELCESMIEHNNKLKKAHQEKTDHLLAVIRTKPSQKVTYIVQLPDEIKTNDYNQNIAFTRTFKVQHIQEAVDRINAVTKKFIKTSNKILQDDYVTLLGQHVIMHQELRDLGEIVPAINRIEPNVNMIADDRFSQHKKVYLAYLKEHLPHDEYTKRTTLRPELAFHQFRGK